MTRKEKLLRMVERLGDAVSFERLIYQVTLLKGIEMGRGEAPANSAEFDKVCQRIEREWEDSDLRPPTVAELKASLGRQPKPKNKNQRSRVKSA
jgi:hypothetical protein